MRTTQICRSGWLDSRVRVGQSGLVRATGVRVLTCALITIGTASCGGDSKCGGLILPASFAVIKMPPGVDASSVQTATVCIDGLCDTEDVLGPRRGDALVLSSPTDLNSRGDNSVQVHVSLLAGGSKEIATGTVAVRPAVRQDAAYCIEGAMVVQVRFSDERTLLAP